MATTRTPSPSKAAWARARAAELRAAAAALPTVSAHDWRGVRARMATLAHLRAEAAKFDRIAQSYSSVVDTWRGWGT